MSNRFNSVIAALSKAGFVASTDELPAKELDFKITEYNLNTDLSFKFENATNFKEFLKSQKSEIDEERIDSVLNEIKIDGNQFFYVNFFEKQKS